MSRIYKDTIGTLIEEAVELEERRSELKAELSRVETRLAQVKESVNSLSRLEPGSFQGAMLESTAPVGLSDAIRRILTVADTAFLFPTEVRDRLVSIGYDVKQHSNILASVHTCLKRLVDTGEVQAKEIEGKTAYRLWLPGISPRSSESKK